MRSIAVPELPFTDFLSPTYNIDVSSVTLAAQDTSKTSGFTLSKVETTHDPFQAWWTSFINEGFRNQNELLDRRTLRYVDLFSSVGGLSLSLSVAAISQNLIPSPLLAVDLDHAALSVYKKNFNPMLILEQSVGNLVDFHISGKGHDAKFNYAPEILPESVRDLVGLVDVVLAGPPCQGHSTLNNHTRGEDKRNFFYVVTAAVIAALKPKGFIIENVPNVVNDKTFVVESSKSLLRSSGYILSEATLAADSIGWAQTRKRHFLVGTLSSSIVDLNTLASQSSRSALPVSAILSRESRLISDPEIMFTDPQMSPENIKRINWLFNNAEFDLPNSERPKCHQDGHTYPSVYGRMRPNEPSPTLTTGFMSPGRGRFIHPYERRTIRPREAARIQGFPDTFSFEVHGQELNRRMLSKWIGDAVPSILGFLPAFAVVQSIKQ